MTQQDTRREINEILNFLGESNDVSGAASEIMAIINQDFISKASVREELNKLSTASNLTSDRQLLKGLMIHLGLSEEGRKDAEI